MAARATPAIPSRVSPAMARKVAWATPSSSLRIRVCTLPRTSTSCRSGRRSASCARRRKLDDPNTAPCGSAAIPANPGETNPSRTSARSR